MKNFFKKLNVIILCLIFISSPAFAFFEKQSKTKERVQNISGRIEYINQDFFARFNDPLLRCYIVEALENNNDLRKTAWKVEEYRQNVKSSLGKELPSLSVGGSYLGVHTPNIQGINSVSKNAFVMPFVASYEADILLKNRDKTRAVKNTYEAALSDEKGVNIALVSDVATTYTNIVQYDELIKLNKQLLDIKKEKLTVALKSYNAGVIDIDMLNSASQDFETALQNLNSLYKDREKLLTGFSILIGRSPDNISEIERTVFEDFDYVCELPSEVSSEVVFSRPDIIAVEHQLRAARFNVRAVRKELFPTFSINGIWAFSTITSGSFFSWESSVAAILAGATQDIFQGGRKIANLKINKAKYEQMFEDYRKTQLTAVKEVNDALCIVKFDTENDILAEKKLKIQESDFKNTNLKYSSGTISLWEFLSGNEQLILMQQHKAQAKTQRIVNYFTLYKATGGVL